MVPRGCSIYRLGKPANLGICSCWAGQVANSTATGSRFGAECGYWRFSGIRTGKFFSFGVGDLIQLDAGMRRKWFYRVNGQVITRAESLGVCVYIGGR